MEDIVFPNKVRVMRRMRGYTMQELSDHLGLSLSLLSKMEKGFRRISPEQMSKVAEFLDCEFDDLYMNEGDEGSQLMDVWKEAIERRRKHNESNGLRVVGAGLRFIRMQYNITLGDFAKRSGITSSVYHRIEAGEREMYEVELAGLSKALGLMPEDLIQEIYNLHTAGVLEKFSENIRVGRGKPHVSPNAASIAALSKTVYGEKIYKFSRQKMVALLGEGKEDGKLHIDKEAEALVFAPFPVRKKKDVYAIKSHPKAVKHMLPEQAVYFVRSESDVRGGDLAIIYEKDFHAHEKHDAELVSVEEKDGKIIATSHTTGTTYDIASLDSGRIHRVVFIALDLEQ
ncbi:MAG: helix-turn-helix transcriptional regulator [Alphaproteobacteria bacterium]|nr:helix-turn-helix transcriptional regulator [Alphaproteobacteria bacterium]MBN2779767.1 helix-turn-helix transcriptional regulator [Alphaproteobacteria bacterium]